MAWLLAAAFWQPLWAFSPVAALRGDDASTSPGLSEAVPTEAPRAFAIRAESQAEPRRRTYPCNRTFDYVAQARWRGELGAVSVQAPQTPELQNLECLKMSVANFTHPESNEASAEFRFSLRPIGPGPAHVGRVEIEYSTGPQAPRASLTAEGLDLDIGKPERNWRRIGAYAGAGLAALGALAASVVLAVGRLARRERPAAAPPSPFEDLRERMAGLDRSLIEGDFSAYYGELREILCKAMSLAGLLQGRLPTATEFAEWLAQRSDEERQANRDCLTLLEQAEAVRFAGRRPTTDDNRAARKELEAALSRLERMALGPQDKEKE